MEKQNYFAAIEARTESELTENEIQTTVQTVSDLKPHQFILKDTEWFTVDYGYAAAILRDCVDNYKTYIEKSRKQAFVARESFSLDKMAIKLLNILDTKVPKPVEFKLPQLKKIELPKIKK